MRRRKGMTPTIRSSAVEYLTFIAATGEGGVDAVYADENTWLSQKMLGELYQVTVPAINQHLKRIFDDSELQADSVIKDFLITAADGKNYKTKHYNLQALIAVGYKVNSERAVQFRKWATGVLESYTIKGFAMDDERLKSDGSKAHVLSEFEKYRIVQDRLYESDSDRMLKQPGPDSGSGGNE